MAACNFCVCIREKRETHRERQIQRDRYRHTQRLSEVDMIAGVPMHSVQMEVRDYLEGVGSYLLCCFEAESLL